MPYIFHITISFKNIPNIFQMYYITEYVIFRFCVENDLDDIQTVLWLHKLIIRDSSVNHKKTYVIYVIISQSKLDYRSIISKS